MQKGQVSMVTGAIVLLVLAAVGIVIVNGVTAPLCATAHKTCETGDYNNATYYALLHGDIYENSETVYNSTDCTGGAMTNYDMNYTDGGIILTGDDTGYDGHNQSITYDYYQFGTGSLGNGILALIICYLPIIFAIAVLALAGYILLMR